GGAGVKRPAAAVAGKGFAGEPDGGEAEVVVAFEAAEIGGEETDLGDAAVGFADEAAEVAEIGQRTDRATVAGDAGDGGPLGGRGDGELELVAARGAPGIEVFGTEF